MTTWILVADEARARLFEAVRRDGEIEEIYGFVHEASRAHGRDLTTERPSRTQESVGGARHAIEPHTDIETIEAQRFARALAEFLEGGRTSHRFDQLTLLAAPRFLGLLRSALGTELRKLVTREVAKEVTTERADQIQARLKQEH
jgi:protein required for attachment to host cells